MSFICLETTHSSTRSLCPIISMIQFHLKWWMDTNCFILGTSIHPPDPNTFLFTDAIHFGWGAHLEPVRLSFHGHCLEDQSQRYINILEIRLALKKAIKYIHYSCVMISTDNTTVVSYINKQGGTHSPNLCIEIWKILHWSLEHDIVIRVRHIPGRFSILADCFTRLDRPLKTEWALDQSVVNSIFQMLNYPNVDLFVTRFNHKLVCISSSGQSCLSIRRIVNELELSSCICIPQTILIPSVLAKIRQSRAE